MLRRLFLLVLSSLTALPAAELAFSSGKHILQQLLIGYDRADLPTSGPIFVDVGLMVEDILGISQTDGSFEADIRFTQIWNDPNLSFSHIDSNRANITLDFSVLDSLWKPNTCFVNSKHTRVHFSPAPNILLLISPNGTVWLSYRVRVEGPCDRDMSNFPMDVQRCRFVFESYSYNAAEVQLQWLTQKGIHLAEQYSIPEFVLVNVTSERNQLLHTAGAWSQLLVRFTFKRKLGYYMLQVYLPTLICVAVSWVSFYLDTTATPARATVGVSTLMALLLTYGNIASGLPRVSYLRAIDIWMTVCMLLTFCALLEFAFVGFVEKRRAKLMEKRVPGDSVDALAAAALATAAPVSETTAPESVTAPVNTLGRSVDAISAKAFPFLFLTFMVCYWTYYLRCYLSL